MESDIAARIVVKEKQDQKKASITSMMSQSLKESVRILLKRKIIESEIFTAIMWGNVERTECAKGRCRKGLIIDFKNF